MTDLRTKGPHNDKNIQASTIIFVTLDGIAKDNDSDIQNYQELSCVEKQDTSKADKYPARIDNKMMKQEDESEIEMLLDGAGKAQHVEEQIIPGMSADHDIAAKKRTKLKAANNNDPTKRRARKRAKDENAVAVLIKYAALFLLVAQMVGLVLLMRYTRTVETADRPLYLASTAVFVMEVMKLAICCLVVAYQSGGNLFSELNTHVIQAPMELLKLCIPSVLYTIQNNLLYLALTNLDAATYQVCYQLKILTTALFSAILLQVRTAKSNADSALK